MNELAHPPVQRPTTQAAEGLPRLRWTLAEFDRLSELGVFRDDDRIELIGGELVPMQSKGGRHELVKTKILNWMMRRLPHDLELSVELGWRPGEDMYLEPDIVVYRAGPSPSHVPAGDALLVIEVADSSLLFDTGRKAGIYAALGVRDYWVVNTTTLVTRVYREPSSSGYGKSEDVSAADTVVPLLLPSLAVKLADLGLG